MIKKELTNTVSTLTKLINTTDQDIADIKAAKHDELLKRMKSKEELVRRFETEKTELDIKLAEVVDKHAGVSLAELFDDETHALLDRFRNALEELHEKNKKFAVLSLTVGEFFTSLLSSVIPSEQAGYGREKSRAASPSFLTIKG